MDYIEALELNLDIKAKKNFMPIQSDDVYKTYADSSGLFEAAGYEPQTPIKEGVENFVQWYRDFYNK